MEEIASFVGFIFIIFSLVVLVPGIYVLYKFINYLKDSSTNDASKDRQQCSDAMNGLYVRQILYQIVIAVLMITAFGMEIGGTLALMSSAIGLVIAIPLIWYWK